MDACERKFGARSEVSCGERTDIGSEMRFLKGTLEHTERFGRGLILGGPAFCSQEATAIIVSLENAPPVSEFPNATHTITRAVTQKYSENAESISAPEMIFTHGSQLVILKQRRGTCSALQHQDRWVTHAAACFQLQSSLAATHRTLPAFLCLTESNSEMATTL